MTAVTDATLIIETLIGRNLTAEQLTSVADAVCYAGAYDKASPAQIANFANLTNEEKAQVVLDDLVAYLRSVLQQKAAYDIRQTIPAAQAATLATLG